MVVDATLKTTLGRLPWIRNILICGSEAAIMNHFRRNPAIAPYEEPVPVRLVAEWEKALRKWINDQIAAITILEESCDFGLPIRDTDLSLTGLRSIRLQVDHRLHMCYRVIEPLRETPVNTPVKHIGVLPDITPARRNNAVTIDSLFNAIWARSGGRPTVHALGVADEIHIKVNGLTQRFFHVFVFEQNSKDSKAVIRQL